MKIGIIGLGEMGRSFASLLLVNLPKENLELFVYNRAERDGFPELKQNSSVRFMLQPEDVFIAADIVFSAISTKAQLPMLRKIADPSAHYVSLSNGLELGAIKEAYKGSVSRIMPTVVSTTGRGFILVCHDNELDAVERQILEKLLSDCSRIKVIEEKNMDLLTELTSCGPGLYAAMIGQLVEAATGFTDLPGGEVEEIIRETIHGTLDLLDEQKLSLNELIAKVATTGGTTEVGVRLLQNGLPEVFTGLFRESLEHNRRRKEETGKK